MHAPARPVTAQQTSRSSSPLPRLIVSLCDFSGNWPAPYTAPGYEIITVDLKHGRDVCTWQPPRRPWGVLAAPPCTHFTNAGSAHWHDIPRVAFLRSLEIVLCCLRLCEQAESFWCLENPRGRLGRFIGPHAFEFQPWWYGDPWSKRTCLWGHFRVPQRRPIIPTHALVGGHRRQEPTAGLFGRVQLPAASLVPLPSRLSCRSAKFHLARQTARSNTPPGFARAFREANP